MAAEKRDRDYAGLARQMYEAAQNENYPPALRAYYAGVALWADKKAQAQK